jgi:D-galactarolactone cycloisomerase
MKIAAIRTYHLRSVLKESFSFSQWSYDQRNVLIVEIVTDSGLSGWGECYGPAEVLEPAVAKYYGGMIMGEDPLSTEVIWHKMWLASLDFARGGLLMAAMSGIDMALWDLKGKILGLSLSQLFGGQYRDRIPCYATGIYFRELLEDELLSALREEAVEYERQGFKAIKIKIGKNPEFDEKLIWEIREALPDTQLMADSNHAYDLIEAIMIGKVLDEAKYAWFEEPLSPEHPELFRQLHSKIDIPIAAGECVQTRYGFESMLKGASVQVCQPDLAYCGGPSEALKIRALASSIGINVVPHVWGTMFNLAAATHFLANSYHEPGRQEPKNLFLEYDRTENPLRDELFSSPVRISPEGAEVPVLPGLGVEIDQQKMRDFLVSKQEVSMKTLAAVSTEAGNP